MKIKVKISPLFTGLRGSGGIEVKAAGKHVVIDGSSVAGGSGGINTSNVVAAVGSTGYLTNVYAAAATTNTYPTAGAWVTGSGNVSITNTGLTVTGTSTNTVYIGFADIARNLYIRTINVCDNGTVKSMDIIASAAY